MARACSTNAGENACRILVGNPEGMRPVVRPIRRWVDNIQINLREIGWCGMYWIDLAQDREPVEGSCQYGNESSGSIKYWKILE
jgi:hypothetical protein